MKHLDTKEQFNPVQEYLENGFETTTQVPNEILNDFYKLYTKTISRSFETSFSTEEAIIIAFSG